MLAAHTAALGSTLDSGHAAHCFRDHEEREHTLVRILPHQHARSSVLCEQHGWQGQCERPCTRVDVYADSKEHTPCHSDVSIPSTPVAKRRVTMQLLERAGRAALTGGATALRPEWQGKLVRVRAFVSDGFFVRVHMVMTQGIWASLRGLPFFAQLHGDASCSDLKRACVDERYSSRAVCFKHKTCDAYSDQDGWEEYFEPIYGQSLRSTLQNTSEERIIELSCPAAWYFNQGVLGGHTDVGIYASDWKTATAFRERNAALVAAWVRVRPSIRAKADAEWKRITRGATAVIGVHLRGTDKFVMPKVPPQRYYALIDAYIAQHGGCADAQHPLIYLATDDAGYQRALLQRYGEHCVAQLNDGNIKRAHSNRALWADRTVTGDTHAKGQEVILDALLLSKCDFLLKSASSVSEFAIYWNSRLVNESYDFSLDEQPEPSWLKLAQPKEDGGQSADLANDPASKCVEQELHGKTAVHHWQRHRGALLCAAHGWQGSCSPPCTTVSLVAQPTEVCNDPLHPPHPAASQAITRQLLAGKSAPIIPHARKWQGKSLRIRSFVDDGFWVRAHFVLTQGLWATLRGLRFFVDMHNATCARQLTSGRLDERDTHVHVHVQAERRLRRQQPEPERCDAYSSHRTDMRRSAGWEEYFEPIGGILLSEVYISTPEAKIIELSCPAAWYFNEGVMGGRMATEADWGSGYPRSRQEAVQIRTRNAALVAAWVRVRPSVRAQADAEWKRITRGASAVIGVHLRGTDKFVSPKVPPQRYFALIDAFVSSNGMRATTAHPSHDSAPLIFLATDDVGYQRAIVQRYGVHRVAQLHNGDVRRAEGEQAIWKQHAAETAHEKGLDVLLDTLLLSKCDFLLKSASAVSEFALYFAPRLINRSYDFSLEDEQVPGWAAYHS